MAGDDNFAVSLDDLKKLHDLGQISPETLAIAEQKLSGPQSVPIDIAGAQQPISDQAAQALPGQGAPMPGQTPPDPQNFGPLAGLQDAPEPGAPGTPIPSQQDPDRTPAAAPDVQPVHGSVPVDSLVRPASASANPAQAPNPYDQELAQTNQAFQQERDAANQVANARGTEESQAAHSVDQAVTNLNALQAKWQQRESDWHQQSQQYVEQMNNFVKQQISAPGIDPHRYMNSLSTGGKIAAAVSLLFGGIAGGMNGSGGNVALDIIKRNVDRDVEAQKFDYERNQSNVRNQMSLYGMLRDQFGDDRNAELATRSGMLEVAKLQIQKQASMAQSAIARAQGLQALGQLNMQQAQLNSQIYTNKYRMQAMAAGSGGQGLPGQALISGLVPSDQVKNAVKLPNGNYGFSTSEKQAEDTNKAALKYEQINSTLDEMQKVKDGAGTSLPLSEARSKANALGARLAPMLNEYYGINRLSDTDFEHVLKPQIPDATSLFQGNAQTRLDTLRSSLKKDHDIMLKHGVIGYQPVDFQTQVRP